MKTISRLDALLAQNPNLACRYERIKTVASNIAISGYDITNKCNLYCKGCFFFEGEKSSVYADSISLNDYDMFFASEVQRGVTMPHFAGAEPALVPDRLAIAARHWSRGVIYTNGTIPIDKNLPFKIHVSVWGGKDIDASLRGGSVFEKALRAYQGDRRAIFVYTINSSNIHDIRGVVEECNKNNLPITFNYYSPTPWHGKNGDGLSLKALKASQKRLTGAIDNMSLTAENILDIKKIIRKLLLDYPSTVIYSLAYDNYICSEKSVYNINPSTGVATNCSILNSSVHRQYRTDLSWDDSECCIANVDCSTCRHYVGGYSMAMSSMRSHLSSVLAFSEWLEMYETWCRLNFVDW